MKINIQKLRERVEAQRMTILSKIKRLRREDPFVTEDRAIIVEPGTDASALFGHEKTMILENQLKNDLKEIESALAKIKKGTYGICERCGKAIDSARLEVKPSAIYCMNCERELEKKSSRRK